MKTRVRPLLQLLAAAASAVVVLAGLSAPTIAAAHPDASGFSASPTTLDFGSVAVNTPAKASVTLTVPAGLEMSEQGVEGQDGSFTEDDALFDACYQKPGPRTCPIGWIFTPTGTGAHHATGTITGCPVGGGDCVSVEIKLEGTGVAGTEPGSGAAPPGGPAELTPAPTTAPAPAAPAAPVAAGPRFTG